MAVISSRYEAQSETGAQKPGLMGLHERIARRVKGR